MMITRHKTPVLRLILLSIALLAIGGCESLTQTSSSPASQENPVNSDILIPTDLNTDQAEAEFERSILREIEPFPLQLATPLPHTEIWDELADQFHLIETHHESYQNYLAFYLNNTKHLERVSVRAQPYLYFIMDEIRNRDLPYELALLPIIESAFYPYALSSKRAGGLWQFIPSTGRIYGLKQDWWFDGRQDVYMSTHAALDFLESLYRTNNNDWFLALASYNAGYGRIQQATARLKRADPNAEINYWTIRPYLPRETRHYVPQLLAVSYLIKNREKYNLDIHDIPNEPYLTYIELDRQMDLNKAAEMAGLSKDIMKHLNPGYLKSVTPPDGPHHLLIPLSHKDAFEQKLAENTDDIFNIRWQRHHIVAGDSLGTIAQRYSTSIGEIRRLNNIKGNMIRAGRTLLIPIPASQAHLHTQLAQNTTNNDSDDSNNKSFRTHYVQRGESLWTISNYYGLDSSQLAQWNNLNPRDHIRIGQRLEIRSNKYGHTVQHTVKDGESLWLIARRYQVTIQDLTRWNRISSANTLRPGTELTIWRSGPPDLYTVKRGDTLWDIARAFNINSETLKKHNKLSQNEFLRPGQVLRIPNDS